MRVLRASTGVLLVTGLVAAFLASDLLASHAARGEAIAFIRDAGGLRCAVFIGNSNGTGQRRLSPWNASCTSPAVWSPDGRQIAFYGRTSVWLMNADGSRRRRLASTTPDESDRPGPSFSPDGTRIAFVRNPSQTINANAIYVIATSGGRAIRLTRERFAYDPLWSPRGDLIAFRSSRDDDEGEIYLMRPDGSRQRRLTAQRHDVESIAWSPDGAFLAFAFYDGPIYRVRAAGGSRRLLARISAAEPDLAWSPNGRLIAYGDESAGNDISVMAADGFNERRLTRRFFNFDPSWSPDSRSIAFAFFTRLEGPSRSGLAVLDVRGVGRRQLTRGADAYPAWQPTP